MMRKIQFVSFLYLIILLSNTAIAQLKANTAYAKGHLIDSKSKAVIPYAVIRIKNTGKYVMSNANGDFELEVPKMYWRQKEINLEIIAENYETKVLEFDTKRHKENKVFLVRLKRIYLLNKTNKKQ